MISDLSVDSVSPASAARTSVNSVSRPEGDLSFAAAVKELASLSRAAREELTDTLLLLRRIHAAKSKSAEARAIAATRAGQRGFSAESLLRKYYRYLATNDWRDVLDRAKAGPAFWDSRERVGLPPAFVEFWKSLCERNQRKTAPARRELINRIWRTHWGISPATGQKIEYKKIPGYDTWPEADPLVGYPLGWSQANLNRYAPTKFELAAARQGRESAAQYRRKVYTTRHGLRVGQFFVFDDQEYDTKVNFPNSPRAMRPVGLNVLDIFSAHCCAWGVKPVLIDDDGTKKKGLQQYMPWLAVHVLCNIGYLVNGPVTNFIIEAGSATLNDEFIGRLLFVTNDRVEVHKGRSKNTPSFPGLFEGAHKGNPRFKAHIESFFNLVRNDFAALPGAVGMNRDHCPAELAGRDRYNEKLIKAAQSLSPERAALLRRPFLDFNQFVQIAAELYNDINNRTDHNLEGWPQCGHLMQEMIVALGDRHAALTEREWDALPRDKQNALRDHVHARSRYLSPQEVFNRGAAGLQKLPYASVPVLLGPDYGVERKVDGGYISFHDQDLDSADFLFPCQLGEGQKFMTYQIPFAPDVLILADAKGAFVGTLPRQETPNRAEADKIAAQIKYAAQVEAELLTPSRIRATPLAKAKLENHQINARVLLGQPVTDAELAAAADLRARVKKVTASDVDAMVGIVAPRDPSENIGCNVTLPPSAQDAPAASSPLDSDINDLL